MKKVIHWKYIYFTPGHDNPDIDTIEFLNREGLQGWEIHTMENTGVKSNTGESQIKILFKREILP